MFFHEMVFTLQLRPDKAPVVPAGQGKIFTRDISQICRRNKKLPVEGGATEALYNLFNNIIF
jgi:hypothetical protein